MLQLLDVNECEQIVTYDYQELEYVFECVFGLMKKIIAYIIPFDFKFKSKTDQVNQIECYDFCGDQPTTCVSLTFNMVNGMILVSQI